MERAGRPWEGNGVSSPLFSPLTKWQNRWTAGGLIPERRATVVGFLPKHLRRQKSPRGAQEQRGERKEVLLPYILSVMPGSTLHIPRNQLSHGGWGATCESVSECKKDKPDPMAPRAYFPASMVLSREWGRCGCLVFWAEQQRQWDCWGTAMNMYTQFEWLQEQGNGKDFLEKALLAWEAGPCEWKTLQLYESSGSRWHFL